MSYFRQCMPYDPTAMMPAQGFQPSVFPVTPMPATQGFQALPPVTGVGQPMGPMPGGVAIPQQMMGGPTTPKQMTATSMVPPAAGPSQMGTMGFLGSEQPPQTVLNTLYIPGFLKTQIGRNVRVEFLIGTNGMTDRTGTLLGVGASYILLREAETDDVLLCDIYSIKFVKFYL